MFCLLQGLDDKNDYRAPMWLETIVAVSHLAIVFNSSINFYVYLIKRHHMQRKLLRINSTVRDKQRFKLDSYKSSERQSQNESKRLDVITE